MSNNKSTLSPDQIKLELYRRGNLSWKCHVVQKEMYDMYYGAKPHSTLVWLLSRQTGKTFLLCILAVEQALKQKNSIIKFVTDTKIHAEEIIIPTMNQILEDCPEDLKPQYNTPKFSYIFPNGSRIQLAGTDNKHYEKLRGNKSALILIDEAGFCNDLRVAIKSVLFPTTTHTGAKIVLATTPPEDSDHDFFEFMEKAKMNGLFYKKTLFDNPLLSEEQKQAIVDEMGGITSETFRREYLCEIIKNSSNVAIPEMTDDLKERIVKDWITPPFYDSYVSMDLGGKDLTALLFGYYDFRKDKIIIQDEIALDFTKKENNLPLLVKKLKEKEAELWTNPITAEQFGPYLRISDINYIATQEISRLSNGEIVFIHTKKDEIITAVNNLRELLQQEKIIINPKCKMLISHLDNVKWKSVNDKSTFARSVVYSHFDFVSALIYFIRNIHFHKNPYPSGYGLDLRAEDTFYRQNQALSTKKTTNNIDVYKSIFGLKRGK